MEQIKHLMQDFFLERKQVNRIYDRTAVSGPREHKVLFLENIWNQNTFPDESLSIRLFHSLHPSNHQHKCHAAEVQQLDDADGESLAVLGGREGQAAMNPVEKSPKPCRNSLQTL